jgi:hypothetical protein
MKLSFILILVTVILYSLFGFVHWNFNPSNWSEDSRFFLVIVWIVCMFISAGMYSDMNRGR